VFLPSLVAENFSGGGGFELWCCGCTLQASGPGAGRFKAKSRLLENSKYHNTPHPAPPKSYPTPTNIGTQRHQFGIASHELKTLLSAEGRHSNMAADTDATAPATSEDNLVQSLTSSSTTKRTQGLSQLNESIKHEGGFKKDGKGLAVC
jgi:hypothetical protein